MCDLALLDQAKYNLVEIVLGKKVCTGGGGNGHKRILSFKLLPSSLVC